GQGVVVRGGDLVHCDGVVLIEDWHDPVLEQGGEGVARVQEARAVRQVFAREQNLRDLLVHLLEGLLIGPHEAALAHGGGGLLVRQTLGVFRQPQLLDAAHDGARGDHHDLPALRLQRGQLAGEMVDALGVQAAALGGDEAAAHLEHEALGVFDDQDRKSTRLNSSHGSISYAVFCLKKKNLNIVHHKLITYDYT